MRVFGEALSATLVPAAPFTLLPRKFTLKARSTRESPRKVVHLNAHYVNEHDILCLRQEFIDLDGGLQLEGDVGIIERYTKELFKLF